MIALSVPVFMVDIDSVIRWLVQKCDSYQSMHRKALALPIAEQTDKEIPTAIRTRLYQAPSMASATMLVPAHSAPVGNTVPALESAHGSPKLGLMHDFYYTTNLFLVAMRRFGG